MPTDDLIPDWRTQVTINIGPYSDFRLRADTPSDLGDLIDQVTEELAAKVASAQAHFGVMKTVTEGVGPVEQVGTHTTTDSTPRCAHGARTHRSGSSSRGPWQAFFCPQPRGQSQCDPIFKDKDNAEAYPWPA